MNKAKKPFGGRSDNWTRLQPPPKPSAGTFLGKSKFTYRRKISRKLILRIEKAAADVAATTAAVAAVVATAAAAAAAVAAAVAAAAGTFDLDVCSFFLQSEFAFVPQLSKAVVKSNTFCRESNDVRDKIKLFCT